MVEEKAEVVEKKEKKQRKGRYTHRQWGVVTATSPASDILMTQCGYLTTKREQRNLKIRSSNTSKRDPKKKQEKIWREEKPTGIR